MPTDNAATKRGYHHGELKAALIAATDAILRESGIERFTLREAARRAGVSPGAPAHHFGNAAGLLTEVAILGYEEMARYLGPAENGEAVSVAALRALTRAYVHFALDHPGRFRLMFRKDLVNRSNARYRQVSTEALRPFALVAAQAYGSDLETALRENRLGGVLAGWSTAHGIAHLALEDKFTPLMPEDGGPFVDGLLEDILLAQWPDPPRAVPPGN